MMVKFNSGLSQITSKVFLSKNMLNMSLELTNTIVFYSKIQWW